MLHVAPTVGRRDPFPLRERGSPCGNAVGTTFVGRFVDMTTPTWPPQASAAVRHALLLELTQLLDAVTSRTQAAWATWRRERARRCVSQQELDAVRDRATAAQGRAGGRR
jgi:hypothetical protein